jgi:hypothetical protein
MSLRRHIPTLLTTALLAASLCAPAFAQTLTVRILDGKTAAPIPNLQVNIYGLVGGKALPVVLAGDAYTIDITGQTTLKIGELNTATPNPVYFAPCQQRANVPYFDIKQIQAKGIALPNNCSPKAYTAIPGELVIFVHKVPWWDRWKDLN